MKHKFKITLTPSGTGSTVEMDGHPLGVSAISIRAGIHEVTTVTFEIPAAFVEIEAEGEAKQLMDVTKLGDTFKRLKAVPLPD